MRPGSELTDPAHTEGEKTIWSSSFRKKRYRERKEAADLRKRRLKHANEVRTMQKWYDRGVDLDFLLGSLWEEFQEVEADGQLIIELPRDSEDDPVMYLSFFRAKMLNAWRKVEVLQAPARAVEMPPPVNVPLRLVQIVDALPERLPDRDRFAEEILGLEGKPLDDVEDRLEEIETEVLRALHEALEPDEEAELVERLRSAHSVVAGRLPEGERERARRRIYRQLLSEWFEVLEFSVF